MRALCLTAAMLCLFTLPARAQTHWLPTSAMPKRDLPGHLQPLAALPAGSVTTLRRDTSKAGAGWRLVLPGAATLRVRPVDAIRHPNGDVSYSGAIEGFGASFPILVTEGRDASFGTWTTPAGRYRLESWGEHAWLIRLDHPDLDEAEADDHAVVEPGVAALATGSTSPEVSAKATPGTRIDVLFVVSPGFVARYPATSSATRVNHLVALANQLFANSAVDLGLRLVGIDPVAYTDDNGNGIALNDLRLAVTGEATVPGLETLRARRLATGADLVTLARPHDIETRGSCGIAYLFGRGADRGVNVLSDGFSSWSICSDETYAHEVGHNLGAEHQIGATSANPGYGTAHVVLGQFHTVMGSFGTGSPDRGLRLQRFSNPQQRCGGKPCGVEGVADNARRLRDTMDTVAGYMPEIAALPDVDVPAAVDPDEDGDGVPESLDAFPHDPAHQGDRDGDGVADALDAFPDDAGASADLDGDGIGDNVDVDIDGDGVVNALDMLPRDASASVDSDGDAVGDGTDRFSADRREWSDLDGDGVGDNADPDVDGDGASDFGAGQDLLVASLGTDRVIRLDGEHGRFIAVEIAESHLPLALGSKSALAWNPYRRRVEALIASEVRRYDPFTRQREARVLRSFRGAEPGLRSGLSAAMTVGPDGTVLVAGDAASLHGYDPVSAQELVVGVFSQPFARAYVRAMHATATGSLWVLDRDMNLAEVGISGGALRRELAPDPTGVEAGTDPAALVTGPDAALYVADARGHRVLRIDPATGVASVFVTQGSGGLQRPAGLAFDAAGRLYVASAGSGRVLRYAADGGFIDVFSDVPSGRLIQPGALLFVPRVQDRFPRDAARRVRPRVGAWYSPATSGQGIDLQAIPGGLAFAWYTYEEDGRATWYLAVGALDGEAWSAPLQRFTWDGQRAVGSDVGSVALDFLAEDRATLTWTLDGRSGSETLQHLQTGRSVETQFPTAVWYAPATPGWGYSITRQGEVLAIAAFVFDRNGEPSWTLAVGGPDAGELAMQRLSAPGACPGRAGNTRPQASAAGTVRFLVHDEDRASGSLVLEDAALDWRHDTLDLRRLSETPTEQDGDPRP